jgi:Phosphotransferase enzyme family
MWILMTRLPGQILQPSQIEPHQADSIMKQLAGYVSQWRNIPAPTQHIGNLRFIGLGREHLMSGDGKSTFLSSKEIAVHGLIFGSAASAVRSPEEYYTTKLCNEVAILKDNDNYTPNRATIVPLTEELLHDNLPNTTLFHRNHNHSPISIFTHYDLSPRNILISLPNSSAAQISGIVDFEFSGFFPAEEEFANTYIAGEGDWPLHAWTSLIEHLEARNVEFPAANGGGKRAR